MCLPEAQTTVAFLNLVPVVFCSWMEFPVPLPDFVISQRSTGKNVFPVINLSHHVFVLKERGEEKVQQRPVCFDVASTAV